MSDFRDSCSVCDRRIDPHGRDGTRCDRCNQPCPTCRGVIGFCRHALPPLDRVRFDTCPENNRPRFAA